MAKPKTESKFGQFVKKSLTALVMIPFVILVLYAGSPYIDLAVLAVGALLSWEWAAMVKNKKPSVYALCYILALVLSLLDTDMMFVALAILALTVLVWFKAKDEPYRKLLALGVPYISIGLASLSWIYFLSPLEDAFFVVLWLMLMVWSMDTGGYVVGCSLKGPKLAPKISPNKTWSGFLGGIALAIAVTIVFFSIVGGGKEALNATAYVAMAVIAVVVAVLAQIGDLVESAIKRKVGVKDSSDLIPGHGGIFDRIDSLIFTTPFVALWMVGNEWLLEFGKSIYYRFF